MEKRDRDRERAESLPVLEKCCICIRLRIWSTKRNVEHFSSIPRVSIEMNIKIITHNRRRQRC